MVVVGRLELPWETPPEPKSGAYTNSAIRPLLNSRSIQIEKGVADALYRGLAPKTPINS